MGGAAVVGGAVGGGTVVGTAVVVGAVVGGDVVVRLAVVVVSGSVVVVEVVVDELDVVVFTEAFGLLLVPQAVAAGVATRTKIPSSATNDRADRGQPRTRLRARGHFCVVLAMLHGIPYSLSVSGR